MQIQHTYVNNININNLLQVKQVCVKPYDPASEYVWLEFTNGSKTSKYDHCVDCYRDEIYQKMMAISDLIKKGYKVYRANAGIYVLKSRNGYILVKKNPWD